MNKGTVASISPRMKRSINLLTGSGFAITQMPPATTIGSPSFLSDANTANLPQFKIFGILTKSSSKERVIKTRSNDVRGLPLSKERNCSFSSKKQRSHTISEWLFRVVYKMWRARFDIPM